MDESDDVITPVGYFPAPTPEQVAEQKLQSERWARQTMVQTVMQRGADFGITSIDGVLAAAARLGDFIRTGVVA